MWRRTRDRLRRLFLLPPLAFFLMTCVHAPAEKFQGKTAYAAEKAPESPSGAAATGATGAGTSGPSAPLQEVASATPPAAPTPTALWTEHLDAVRVYYANTEDEAAIRLYAPDGSVDANQLEAFRRIVSAKDASPAPIPARLAQLVVKAAYHFKVHSVVVVSAYRPSKKRSAGKHATGEAIDFKLRGIDSKKLASYVRTFAKAGVGIYTHPDTQYVHLDVREESYHWLDASPPGKSWHEKKLSDPHREERDGAYTLASDLPDGA